MSWRGPDRGGGGCVCTATPDSAIGGRLHTQAANTPSCRASKQDICYLHAAHPRVRAADVRLAGEDGQLEMEARVQRQGRGEANAAAAEDGEQQHGGRSFVRSWCVPGPVALPLLTKRAAYVRTCVRAALPWFLSCVTSSIEVVGCRKLRLPLKRRIPEVASPCDHGMVAHRA